MQDLLSNALVLVIVLFGFSYMIFGGPKNIKTEELFGKKKITNKSANPTKRLLILGGLILLLMIMVNK